ncbi:MAG: hypothetical protein IAF58_09925 [Leptolyngbya sp.]|nr:hypothetical protein [Candidatus Melainabacteria bacterium]
MSHFDRPNVEISRNDIDINVERPNFSPGRYTAREFRQDLHAVHENRVDNLNDQKILPRLDLAAELRDKQPGLDNISPKELAEKLTDGNLRPFSPVGRALRHAIREASADGNVRVGEVVANLNDILEEHGRRLKVVGTPEGQRPYNGYEVSLYDSKNELRGSVYARSLGRK